MRKYINEFTVKSHFGRDSGIDFNVGWERYVCPSVYLCARPYVCVCGVYGGIEGRDEMKKVM